MSVHVFVIEDHPLFRDGLRYALGSNAYPGERIEVVGEAGTHTEALRQLGEVVPPADVVLLDLRLSGESGIETIRAIVAGGLRGRPTPKVLVLSATVTDDLVLSAVRAGARGYLDKGVSLRELLYGIQIVAMGGAVFSPAIAVRLQSYLSAVHTQPTKSAFPDLTERELEILDLLARGYNNRRIARELVLAEKTVRNHISHLFAKLRVTDRAEAVVRARAAGLGT